MSSWTTYQYETTDESCASALAEEIRADKTVFAPNDELFSMRQFDEMVYVQVLPQNKSERAISSREPVDRYTDYCSRIAIAFANDVTNSGRAILYSVEDASVQRVTHMRGEEHRALADLVIRFEEEYGFRLRATAVENHGGELNFGIKFYDATEGFDPMYETAKELEKEADVERIDEGWWD